MVNYDRVATTVDYIRDRYEWRVAGGALHGEAIMEAIAKLDPDLYTLIIGSRQWDSIRLGDQERVTSLLDWLITDYYSNPKVWK